MNPRSFWCAIILSDHFVFFIFFRPAAIILPIICIFIFFAQPSRSFAIISFLFIFSTGVLEAQNTGGLPKNTQIQLLAALHQFLPLPVAKQSPLQTKTSKIRTTKQCDTGPSQREHVGIWWLKCADFIGRVAPTIASCFSNIWMYLCKRTKFKCKWQNSQSNSARMTRLGGRIPRLLLVRLRSFHFCIFSAQQRSF